MGEFCRLTEGFSRVLGDTISDMNAAFRTSFQAKLGRWATSMRKYIAARRIERRVVDRGMHQEKTIVTFNLGKSCPKCITGNMVYWSYRNRYFIRGNFENPGDRCLPGGGRISGKEGSCDVTLPTMSSTIQVLVIYINEYQIHENCNGKKSTWNKFPCFSQAYSFCNIHLELYCY